MATYSDEKKAEPLNAVSSDNGESGVMTQDVVHDPVFGEVTKEGPNYKGVSKSDPRSVLKMQ